MCKSRPGELQQTQALPFMLDLTLALVTDMQPPSIVQSSLDEVVFQATLQASSTAGLPENDGQPVCTGPYMNKRRVDGWLLIG